MPPSILKTVKSTLSLCQSKNTIKPTDNVQLNNKEPRDIFDETEMLIKDMEQELDHMPDSYKVRHQNRPFLNKFLRQVDIRNLHAIYHLKHHTNQSSTN